MGTGWDGDDIVMCIALVMQNSGWIKINGEGEYEEEEQVLPKATV